jgi:hypothetical protein
MRIHDRLPVFSPDDTGAIGEADLLSDELWREHNEIISRQRETQISNFFVLPPERTKYCDSAERIVEVRTGQSLRYEGTERRFVRMEIPTLNVLLAHEGPISLNGIAKQINAHTTTQVRAIRTILQKMSEPELGAFVKVHEDSDGLCYEIDSAVAFIDRRQGAKTRSEYIRELCRRYADDPHVMRAVAPLLRAGATYFDRRGMGYDSIKTDSLGPEAEEALAAELTVFLERYKNGETTEDEQRQAVIGVNTLVYSLMPLARYMVLESAGRIYGRSRTPLSGFLRRFFEADLTRPLDDAMQLAAVGLIKAIHTHNQTRGDLLPHAMMTISFEVRNGILDTVRHVWGHTATDIKENNGTPPRRSLMLSEEDHDIFTSAAIQTENSQSEHEYEQLLADMSARSVLLKALNKPSLQPIDRLIISLASGVYLHEFEGFQFTSREGRQFTYDHSLTTNPLFREGLTVPAIANILGSPEGTVRSLRRAALAQLEDALRQNISKAYYDEKWGRKFSWL